MWEVPFVCENLIQGTKMLVQNASWYSLLILFLFHFIQQFESAQCFICSYIV